MNSASPAGRSASCTRTGRRLLPARASIRGHFFRPVFDRATDAVSLTDHDLRPLPYHGDAHGQAPAPSRPTAPRGARGPTGVERRLLPGRHGAGVRTRLVRGP